MLLAGLMYSSWPLGYWLNPTVESRLASDLEALHEPFNWLFILLDIASGCLIAIGCWKLFALARSSEDSRSRLGLGVAIGGATAFGFFTALDAILPLNCLEGTPNCQTPLENPYFLIHGFFSVGSIAALTVSIVAIWLVIFLRNESVISLVHLTPVAFLLVWAGFGLLTMDLVMHGESSGLAQHFFIAFCSLWLITLPYFTRSIVGSSARIHS
jgi:hypothetical protein